MPVDVTQQGTTLVVRINRPERRNALDTATMEALGLAFEAAERDDGVRVVVLTGAGCSTRLAARVPPAIAAQLALTGDPVSAVRAWELGLVNEVVPAAALLDRALALAERIAANAPLAARVTKEILAREQGQHDAAEWAAIRRLAAPVFASAEAAEGRAAFAERRAPVWQGR